MPIFDLSKERELGEVLETFVSRRGTRVEMMRCPNLGIACYMDGTLQSCELDEKVYHEALVSSVINQSDKYEGVLIIGGGEGAVAREVLSRNHIKYADMVDWDEEVVRMFKERYPQWGKNAWNDPRLQLSHEDAIDRRGRGFSHSNYDVILVDLFDLTPEMVETYKEFFVFLKDQLKENGSIAMYAGMYSSPATQEWISWCTVDHVLLPGYMCNVSRKYITSFEGEATFIVWSPRQ